jgi:hypothetical protein
MNTSGEGSKSNAEAWSDEANELTEEMMSRVL